MPAHSEDGAVSRMAGRLRRILVICLGDPALMSRPLRIEFPGALYHVTSRGNRREAIFVDDADRRILLGVVASAAARFDARITAYCLMGNHYNL